MDKTFDQMTTDEKMAALRSMTVEQRIEALRPTFSAPLTVSFGKTPPGGWKESDRVPK